MSNELYDVYCNMRDFRGVKDARVAQATGIPKSTFSDWKSGRSFPKSDKLEKIASYFGVELAYWDGEPHFVASNDRNVSVLPSDETELLRLYRTLNDSGKSLALVQIRNLSQLSEYTDKNKESSISETG